MKVTFLFFLVIASAAFMSGTAGVAAPSQSSQQTSPANTVNTVSGHSHDAEHTPPADNGKGQKDAKPFDREREQRHVSDKNHPHSPATATRVRPKQLTNNRERFQSGNPTNFHQAGSDKRSAAAKTELIQQETVSRARPGGPASAIRPIAPLRNNVRHRLANPAVIGGLANSVGRNTGEIDGKSVHRRP
jgi:hypothetical protein